MQQKTAAGAAGKFSAGLSRVCAKTVCDDKL